MSSTGRRLDGKVAIVTGGASGFGKAIAGLFAQQGAKVVIADLSAEAGQAVAKATGGVFTVADVTKRSDWEKLLALALDKFGGLDIVVNNAGTSYRAKPTEDVTNKDYDLVFDVNVRSVYLSGSVILPYFLKNDRPGNFINISSASALRPRPKLVWYAASKGAVSNATRALAIEYAQRKIRFNTVNPGPAITGLKDAFSGGAKDPDAAMVRMVEDSVPMGHPAETIDIANACLFLASEESAFVTGIELPVDGGRCA
ncbi:hypothetical protein AYO21_12058 [Fonsecaea monophora]|uniref:Uncharacterized protein n=1 Tax=Fonsecaea monophora TaxID=254056 RepID=A0A177ES77_9EURO|nr:hypothetical protein AYO21_12058 [Fonsecaea monophora]OAG33839.1 hypothetical protein AYO21_12058 [Fonsecaea monophora]